MDFGMAAAVAKPAVDLMFTQCGTPEYVAPEVLDGIGYIGHKADIWSSAVDDKEGLFFSFLIES